MQSDAEVVQVIVTSLTLITEESGSSVEAKGHEGGEVSACPNV